jgi:hypothetical protein
MTNEINVDLGSPEELERWLERYFELKDARRDHPYVGDLIRVVLPYDNGLRRSMVLHELQKQRKAARLPIPPTFEQAVQSSYNQYCVDSAVFRKRKAVSRGPFLGLQSAHQLRDG